MYEKMGDAKEQLINTNSISIEEIGNLTKDMMFDKYDSMKSLTKKMSKVKKLLFLSELWR
jgi:hypothetical protein